MARRPDGYKAKRLTDEVEKAKLSAVRYVRRMVTVTDPLSPLYIPDSAATKSQLTGRTIAALALTQIAGTHEKAKIAAQNAPTVNLGVVVAVPRMASASEWEQMHARVEAGDKDVIDVPALPAVENPDGG